jgi:hypothetical protein
MFAMVSSQEVLRVTNHFRLVPRLEVSLHAANRRNGSYSTDRRCLCDVRFPSARFDLPPQATDEKASFRTPQAS